MYKKTFQHKPYELEMYWSPRKLLIFLDHKKKKHFNTRFTLPIVKISLTKGSKSNILAWNCIATYIFASFVPTFRTYCFGRRKYLIRIFHCNKYYFENICPSLIWELYCTMTLSKYEKCVWNFLFPIAKNLRNVFWLHASSLIINWLLFFCSQ